MKALLLLIFSCCMASVSIVDAAIYGNDSRKEPYEVSALLQEKSDSIVSLWSQRSLYCNPDTKTCRPFVGKYGELEDLCQTQKFWDQPIGAYGSGALVGEDLVLTAGHAVLNQAMCDTIKIVFGYAMGKSTATIPEAEVYHCVQIVGRHSIPGRPDADYAVIKLDRKVPADQHKPLEIERDDELSVGDTFVIAGYPTGLPLKITDEGKVVDISSPTYYTVEVDVFPSNSGGPVLNPKTGAIQGIVVGLGDRADWVKVGNDCFGTAFLPPVGAGSRGVSVTKPSVYQHLIPELP